jgi:hypothetical protein
MLLASLALLVIAAASAASADSQNLHLLGDFHRMCWKPRSTAGNEAEFHTENGAERS